MDKFDEIINKFKKGLINTKPECVIKENKIKTIVMKTTKSGKDVIEAMRSFADDSFLEAEIYYTSIKEIGDIDGKFTITMVDSVLEHKGL